MIDYRALQAMTAVIQGGSFERAAAALNITQSAVSQRIKLLEARLGQPVLLRQTPPIATELGQRLIGHLQTVQHLEQDLALPSESYARVNARIAVNADSLVTWFARALGTLTDEANIDLLIADQDSGIDWMKRGEVLACLCAEPQPVNGARADYLGGLRYRAYASRAFVQRYQLEKSLATLHQLPCLVFNQDDQLQHRYLAMLNQPAPQAINYCPSAEGFLQLIACGSGFGLMPEIQVRSSRLQAELIELAPKSFIDTPLYWHSWRTAGTTMQKLRSSVRSVSQQYLMTGSAAAGQSLLPATEHTDK